MSIRYLNAVWELDIPTTQKMVALVLADHADESGRCFPSVARMMKMSSLAERSVQNAIVWLEENGHLVREMRCGKSTVYRLTPAADAPPKEMHPRTRCTPTPAGDAPHPRTTCTPTPAPRAPITINRTIKEPSKAKSNGAPAASFQVPDWIPAEPWSAWLDVRKKLKAPNTDRALQLAAKELDRLKSEGHDPTAVLDQSTARGYRGLFPVGNAAPAKAKVAFI